MVDVNEIIKQLIETKEFNKYIENLSIYRTKNRRNINQFTFIEFFYKNLVCKLEIYKYNYYIIHIKKHNYKLNKENIINQIKFITDLYQNNNGN